MHETTSAYLMKENSSENARGKTQCDHNSGSASADQRVIAAVWELFLAFVSVSYILHDWLLKNLFGTCFRVDGRKPGVNTSHERLRIRSH